MVGTCGRVGGSRISRTHPCKAPFDKRVVIVMVAAVVVVAAI